MPQFGSRCAVSAAVLSIAIVLAPALRAQGSADIPLDDNAYYYIDALLARGALHTLSALERPYSVREVIKALDKDSLLDASGAMRGLAKGLRRTLRRYDAGTRDAELRRARQDSSDRALVRYIVGVDGFATAQTSSVRELMLDNQKRAVYPGADLRALADVGPITVVFRGEIDGRLVHDPQFMIGGNPQDNALIEDAYIDGKWKLGELFFGRELRNWGPTPLDGLILGHYAYPYDQIYAVIGPRALHLQFLAARLNDLRISPDTLDERYFSIHRLAARWDRFEIAISEAFTYGGPGRGFELHYLNPVNFFFISQNVEGAGAKKHYDGQLALRTQHWGTYSGDFLLGDVQIPEPTCRPFCQKPPSYGITASVEGFPFMGDQKLFAWYTRVTNLTYRNQNPWETYDYQGVSLGRGYTDYDEVRAGLDLAVVSEVPLKLYASYRRQGQGTYLNPIPPPDSFPVTPTIFSGVVSHIARLAVSGAVTGSFAELSADIGVNHATNYNHVLGLTKTSFAARARVALFTPRLFGGTVRPPDD